jgi:nickel-dependent lactate racemase
MGVDVKYIIQKPMGNIGYVELQNRIAEIQVPQNRPVFVVAEDITRPDHTVCTHLMSHLISMCGHENITLIIGNGMHRAPSRNELMRKFGYDIQWVRTLFNNPQGISSKR